MAQDGLGPHFAVLPTPSRALVGHVSSRLPRLDVIFPRPKLARRLVFLPGQLEDWLYLGGSLGGRTWAVERPSSVSDQLTLRDYRLYLGWERILEGGGGLFVEAGYVFGRELEYEVTPPTQSFNDAFLIRGGMSY